MSRTEYQTECPGCRPAIVDRETGRPLLPDSPPMVVAMEVWATLDLDDKRAYHNVMCNNSRAPEDMERVNRFIKAFQEGLAARMPGPTGEFPKGKLKPEDEGELKVVTSIAEDHVYIEFGKAIKWLAFDPDEAEAFANGLLERAKKLREERAARGVHN